MDATTESSNDSPKWSLASFLLGALVLILAAVGGFVAWSKSTETKRAEHVSIQATTDVFNEPILHVSADGFGPDSFCNHGWLRVTESFNSGEIVINVRGVQRKRFDLHLGCDGTQAGADVRIPQQYLTGVPVVVKADVNGIEIKYTMTSRDGLPSLSQAESPPAACCYDRWGTKIS